MRRSASGTLEAPWPRAASARYCSAMSRPRILLCPQFTEIEWAIAPQLSEWAEVASFDAPGMGDEPFPGDDPSQLDRELVVRRALQEVETRDWDSYFVVGDAWGTATAVRVSLARPEPV